MLPDGDDALVGVVARMAVVAVLKGRQDNLLDRIYHVYVSGGRMPDAQLLPRLSVHYSINLLQNRRIALLVGLPQQVGVQPRVNVRVDYDSLRLRLEEIAAVRFNGRPFESTHASRG